MNINENVNNQREITYKSYRSISLTLELTKGHKLIATIYTNTKIGIYKMP